MSAAPRAPKERETSVPAAKFRTDAGAVIRQARARGSVLVVDEQGKPRMAIYSSRERLPFTTD